MLDSRYKGCPYVIIGADLKSIEPIVNAWLSGDENMKNIFRKGKANPDDPEGDIYCVVGAAASKFSPTVYTPGDIKTLDKGPLKLRQRAKVIFLAPSYSQHWKTLAGSLDCDEGEAYIILKGFYETFPKILEAEHNCVQKVFDGDFVVTHVGARRRLLLTRPYNYSRDLRNRWICELPSLLNMSGTDGETIREANNLRVQNVASQIEKLMLCMMIEEDPEFLEPNLEIHDAPYVMSPIHRVEEACHYLEDLMTVRIIDEMEACGIGLFTHEDNPLRTDIKVGFNRAEMLPLKVFLDTHKDLINMSWRRWR